ERRRLAACCQETEVTSPRRTGRPRDPRLQGIPGRHHDGPWEAVRQMPDGDGLMPEPSRESLLFAAFLIVTSMAASYLHLQDAPAIITFCIGAAAFVLGYRFGLPVQPPVPPEGSP